VEIGGPPERLVRNEEASGSIPLSSTKLLPDNLTKSPWRRCVRAGYAPSFRSLLKIRVSVYLRQFRPVPWERIHPTGPSGRVFGTLVAQAADSPMR